MNVLRSTRIVYERGREGKNQMLLSWVASTKCPGSTNINCVLVPVQLLHLLRALTVSVNSVGRHDGLQIYNKSTSLIT